MAVRIGVELINQADGVFFNPYKQQYFDTQNAAGVRGQVRYKADKLDMNLMIETSQAKLPPLIFAVVIAPGPGFPQGVKQGPFYIGWNGNSVAEQRQTSTIASLKYDLGFANLCALASLRQRDTDHGFDADGLDPDFLTIIRTGGGVLTTDAFQES